MARRILWVVVILFGGAIASERSADILMALSPYRASESRPGGMTPLATPLLATAVADRGLAPAVESPADSAREIEVAIEEPVEEPDAYMAPPLRVQVTTFDGPPGR